MTFLNKPKSKALLRTDKKDRVFWTGELMLVLVSTSSFSISSSVIDGKLLVSFVDSFSCSYFEHNIMFMHSRGDLVSCTA